MGGLGLINRLVHINHCSDYADQGTGLRPEGMGPRRTRGPGGREKATYCKGNHVYDNMVLLKAGLVL